MDKTQTEFRVACVDVGIKKSDLKALFSFLAPLRDKNAITHVHYLHSLRVGLLSRKIAKFTLRDERALLMAGALHDLGKCQVCIKTLGKTDGWTKKDSREMERHVADGFRTLRGRFDFSADTMVRHHSFQDNGYPKKLPKFLHDYSPVTRELIIEHARIVALADVYDALHRVNDKFGQKRALGGIEIKALMFEFNSDKAELISRLYEAEILKE